MAANRIFRTGPVAIVSTTAVTTDLTFPGTATAGTGITPAPAVQYVILRHIRLVNITAGTVNFSLFVGLTTASATSTNFMGVGSSISANSFVDWYGLLRIDNPNGVTGTITTGAASSIIYNAEGEIGVAG